MKTPLSIFNNFPFARLTIAFIAGIIIRNYFDNVAPVFLIPILILIFLTLLLSISRRDSLVKMRILSLFLFLSLVGSGFLYTHYYIQTLFDEIIPEKGTYSGVVLDKAPAKNDRFKYTIRLDCVKRNDSLKYVNEKILLYNSDSTTNAVIEPGKRVLFQSTLYEIKENKNPCEFDYHNYMKIKGIRYQTFVKSGIALTQSEHLNLKTSALNLRSRLMKMYRDEGIGGDEYSVLCALTLGDQNYISNEVKSSFSASGAMHVLSVSGLHVGIVFLIINFLLKPMDKKKGMKIPKIAMLLIFLWFYAFISGLSPSVLRSCSMFSFIVIGENLQRRTNTYNTLAVSAFSLMRINPLIIYDVGFQLSYMAVISIVFFQPRFSALIKTKNGITKYLWDLLTVSIAAQLGTTPVSIYYFHQFPTYFLISNFIVVPLAALILYAALPFFFLSFIPFLKHILAFALNYMTWFLNHSVQFIENFPGSVIPGIWITSFSMILLYGLIIFLTLFILRKRSVSLFATFSILLILLSSGILKEIRCSQQKMIIIYNNSEPLISYLDGKHHYYYSTAKEIKSYSMNELKSVSGYYRTSPPQKIEDADNKSFISGKGYVYLNGNLIKMEDKFSQKSYSEIDFDLIYDTGNSTIEIPLGKGTNRLDEKSATINQQLKTNQLVNLKTEGAFVLNLKTMGH
ncbi:MAG TPA: ComEC/Rec2 family competence protein [Prolixibacteraceae bacterium]|nr:ComEC/Rec2 family competence protein [Prolixibacteraceae bacterium]